LITAPGTRFGAGQRQEAVFDGFATSCTSPTRPASSKIRGSIPRFEKSRLFHPLSVLPEDAPNKPEFVTIDFKRGDAVAVMESHFPRRRDEALNKLGGKHGVGRVEWSRTGSSA